jgi:capsular exopolysaccharide synthesis family protein
MAKVYDALRRAEEERKRRAGDDTSPVTPLDVSQAVAPPRVRRPSLLGSLLTRTRNRHAEPGGAAEVNKRRISLIQPDSYVAEQFRALRGRIDAIAADRPVKTVVVTSAFQGEGKTTSSVNLAAVTALSLGRKVLLIDCDLRKPKVHASLGVQPRTGLAEVLLGEATLEQAICKVDGASFDILPVRSRPSNPSELLGSQEMRQVIADASVLYDRVILDSPAALGLPDVKAISEFADGVVIVVRADFTSQQEVEALLEILGRDRILGLVLNGANVDQARYGYAKA